MYNRQYNTRFSQNCVMTNFQKAVHMFVNKIHKLEYSYLGNSGKQGKSNSEYSKLLIILQALQFDFENVYRYNCRI